MDWNLTSFKRKWNGWVQEDNYKPSKSSSTSTRRIWTKFEIKRAWISRRQVTFIDITIVK